MDVIVFKNAIQFSSDGLQCIGRLCFALIFGNEPNWLFGDIITAGLINDTHGDEARKRLIALLDGGGKIAKWRKNMRTADNTHDHRALTIAKVSSGLAKIDARRLGNTVSSCAEVNAV